MTTKPNRHAMVETSCRWCGETFMARKQRVDKGQSQFCSMGHYREYQNSIGSQRKNIGKENAIIQWEETKKSYVAYWYDENTKYHSAGWARWWWELNNGEVPAGYRVSYRDNNSRNNVPENICLKTMAEISDIGNKNRGVPKSKKTRKLLSIAHTGKSLSEEHKKHIGDANREKWAKGIYDTVHVGEHHVRWRGGVKFMIYPREYYKIRRWIIERDNEICQICGCSVVRKSHVHHIDGNKKHNTEDNLILLCPKCHVRVHSKGHDTASILAFRSKLEWNQNDVEEQ